MTGRGKNKGYFLLMFISLFIVCLGIQYWLSSEVWAVDTIPPVGSILINDGSNCDNNENIGFFLSCIDEGGSGCSQMRLYEYTGYSCGTGPYQLPCPWTNWESYSSNKSRTLSFHDGTKTVYVELKDGAGNISIKYSDSIIIDKTAFLTWTPQTGRNITYRVYRANASGYFPSLFEQSTPKQADTNMKGGKAGAGNTSSLKKFPQYTKQRKEIPEKDFALLGQVSKPEFGDVVPKSFAHYYCYRIVAVNRWGVEGAKAENFIRVPATKPPSVTTVTRVYPDNNGKIVVQYVPNREEEEIVSYRIMKVTLQPKSDRSQSSDRNGSQQKPISGKSSVQSKYEPVKYKGVALVATGPIAEGLGPGSERFGITRRDSTLSVVARARAGKSGGRSAAGLDFAAELIRQRGQEVYLDKDSADKDVFPYYDQYLQISGIIEEKKYSDYG